MMTGEDIDKARRVLGLGPTATLREVKEAYRSLAKKHHPDKEGESERFIEIQNAYRLLLEYINDYKYSFKPEEVRIQQPSKTLWSKYAEDWMWGKT
jgi:preprotein translocase subunit Sec63